MNGLKKIEIRHIQNFVVFFLIVIFLFICLNFYNTVNDYLKIKNKDFKEKNFERIVMDSAGLIIISIIVLVIAAFLEVYITPLLF